MGRPSLFGKLNPKRRYQGLMTTIGSDAFEVKRRDLAEIAGVPVKAVSDGAVFEYLSRGEEATRAYFAQKNGT
jgi:hypothetical protein